MALAFEPNIPFWDANRDTQARIFAGESGGDYNALYGYANRDGGQFAGTNLTNMSVGDVVNFTMPNSPYAQYVRGQVGRTATPVGAYQVVGTTLRAAIDALGIDPSQPFDEATQDRIGQWVLENQGTGAWEGYQGPQGGGSAGGAQVTPMPQQQRPQGVLEALGIQPRGTGPQGDRPFYQRDQFRDNMGRAAAAFNTLRMRPDPNIQAAAMDARQGRTANRTAEWLAGQPGGAEFAAAIQAGADPGQVIMAYRQAQQPAAVDQTSAMQNYQFLLAQGMAPADAMERAFSGGGTNVNVNTGSEVGTIPQGYELFVDPETGARSMRPIAGGPEDTSRFDELGAQDAAASAVNVLEVVEGLGEAVADDPMLTGLVGSIASSIPGTGAYDAARTAETIKANLAFDALAAMRASSPTGGALGAVSERELTLLEAQISSLDLGQSQEQVLANIERIKSEYVRILRKAYETGDPAQLDALFGGRPTFLTESAGQASGGASAANVLTYDPATGEFR